MSFTWTLYMLILGKYETVDLIRRTSSEEIWSARKVGSAGRGSLVAHLYRPMVHRMSQADRHADIRNYLQRIQVEKHVGDVLGAGNARHWPRIHDWGETGDGGAAYISDCPRFALDRLLKLKRQLRPAEIWHIINGMVAGLAELQQACRGRPHGNLHAETVLLGDLRDPTRSPVVLIDPLPPDRLAVYNHPHVDTHGLGALLYEMVEQRRYDSTKPWAVQTTAAWARCGKQEAEWRRLCERLVDTAMPAPSVREIAADLQALRPGAAKLNKRVAIISMVAGMAAAVAIALVIGSFGGAGTPPLTPPAKPADGTSLELAGVDKTTPGGGTTSPTPSNPKGIESTTPTNPTPVTPPVTPTTVNPSTTNPPVAALPPLVVDGSRQAPADLPAPATPAFSATRPAAAVEPVAPLPIAIAANADAADGAPALVAPPRQVQPSAPLPATMAAPIVALTDPIAPTAPVRIAIDLPPATSALKPPVPDTVPATPPVPIAFKPRRLSNTLNMELIEIPAGKFEMGSPLAELDRDPSEKPKSVQVAGILVGAGEVTRGQFEAFIKATGHVTTAEKARGNLPPGATGLDNKGARLRIEGLSWRGPGFDQGDDHPVVCVSWDDATAFCKWLSGKEGRVYRLPTEREWEYACRAGTTTAYSFGDKAADGRDFCNGPDLTFYFQLGVRRNDAFAFADDVKFTAAMAGRKANGWGLFDMHGNVAEWCQDLDTEPGGQAGDFRAVRGGSFCDPARRCRAAARFSLERDQAASYVGFRVVSEKKVGE